jgi:uncharacterized protein YycO
MRAEPGEYTPGDFVLTHADAWTSRLIEIGQGIRFRGSDSRYAHWNHVALIVSSDGDLIEALGTGVQRRNIRVYDRTEYHIVHIEASDEDRDEEVRFAEYSLKRGETYGFLTILSIVTGLVTGGKFNFALEGQQICSGLVARALERTTAIFDRTPSHLMPADLAKQFVRRPPVATAKGTPAPARQGVQV